MKGISVIICCYNSALLLPETLRHLASQKIEPEIFWEVIIVDNLSLDETSVVSLKEWAKYELANVKMRVVSEVNAGLSNARKKGIEEAQFDYVLFCDDDNWLNNDYLQIAYNIIDGNKEIGAVGGQSEAVLESGELPIWWQELQAGYAVGRQCKNSGNIAPHKFLWGAGMMARKNLLKIIFDEQFPLLLSDRKGNELSSGGDVEICARILLLGSSLWYDDRLFFKHYMPRNRLTDEYRIRMFEGHKKSFLILKKYFEIIDYTKWSLKKKLFESVKNSVKLFLPFHQKNMDTDKVKTQLNSMWNLRFLQTGEVENEILRFKNQSKNRR